EPVPAPRPAPVFAGAPSAEEMGEVDFYIEQELFDEARQKVDALAARYPGNRDVQKRRDRVEAAAAAAAAIAAAPVAPPPQQAAPAPAPAPAPAKPAPPPPPPLPKIDIDTELLSALPGDDEELA